MHPPRGARDLELLKWIGVILPIVFIWGFELVRFFVVERGLPGTDNHVLSALLMAGAVVLFGMGMAALIDRAEHELISQNRDLTVSRGVSAAVRGGRPLPEALGQVIDYLASETAAVGGIIRVTLAGREEVVARHPATLPAGLEWVGTLLDEPTEAGTTRAGFIERNELDTTILEMPLTSGGEHQGHLRLVLHPPTRPTLSDDALADIAEEVATAIRLSHLVDDLRRREREQAALYEVALQITDRTETHPVLDAVARHARELLAADRAVVCLARPDAAGGSRRVSDRLALADDGSVCLLSHVDEGGGPHRNPHCPVQPDRIGHAWMSRQLRSVEGHLGELCVVRDNGVPFTDADGSLLATLADMAAIAVTTARLKEAEQQLVIVAERDRIARELHDSLAQVLGHIHLRLRGIETRLDGAAPIIGAELSDLADVADEAYRDVREAILGLRETISSDTGLEGALREYIAKYARQTGIKATFTCDETARHVLPPRAEIQLLRVVQEALTNVRKHAGASRVAVRIQCPDGAPTVEIEDDGSGFDPARIGTSFNGGFGLTSMRERVEQVGGTLEMHTAPGAGTRLVVRLQSEEPSVTPAAPTPDPAGR
jgi:signal transduction histidine kinase